jgi:hypothetical protein
MPNKVRVNLANQFELLELPGLSPKDVDAILRFRAEHGPIKDEHQLSALLGGRLALKELSERADFSPAAATAPEAPGA